jgi:hypothetical protein
LLCFVVSSGLGFEFGLGLGIARERLVQCRNLNAGT